MKTKVIINTYKESGKWYDEIIYESSFECWNKEDLVKETKIIYNQCKTMDFTIRVEQIGTQAANTYLIKL